MITFKVNDEAAFPISGKIAVALALLDYERATSPTAWMTTPNEKPKSPSLMRAFKII